jgi:tetratricopeptide (TPR) repeat protein
MKFKSWKKLLLIVSVLSLLLVAGGFAAYYGYVHVRQERLVRKARGYLGESKLRNAQLCLQRALRYDPKDVAASRLMAELAERSRSPEALIWRNRVVELSPRSLDDRLALAQTAIAVRDFAAATNALAGVDVAGKKTPAYHNIAGVVALTLREVPQAEAHFLEAARLEPTNAVPRLNLSIVHLHGTNQQAVAEARVTLNAIAATNTTLRCQALRELITEAVRAGKMDSALSLSRDLVRQTNSVFSDRLLRLEVLKTSKNQEFKPALTATQREAGTNTAQVYELSMWQISRNGPAETLAWLQSLPEITRTNQPVTMVVAECQIALKDWTALQKSLDKQHWGGLDFMRLAYKTLALRGQGLTGAAKSEWEGALKAAGNQKAALGMLLQLAGQLNMQSEAEEILWSIFNLDPGNPRAAQALSQVLYANGRTRSLMSLFSQQAKRSPTDLEIKNNLAMTAFLLEAQELKPHELAREVYEKASTNASFASTYAFSLHLQKKDAEALKILQQLNPKDREHPSVAGYYGLILKATGDRDTAKIYLNWAFKAPLLPEERKLFEQAKSGV